REGRVEGDVDVLRDRREDSLRPGSLRITPERHRPLAERLGAVRDHAVGIDLEGRPEPVAALARAVRAVEREGPRLERLVGDPARRADRARRQGFLLAL